MPRSGVRYVLADIADSRSLVRALEGVDLIVHAVTHTGSDERLQDEVNRIGTHNILAAADVHGIEDVISISTIGVYGPGPFRNVVEDTRDPAPVTTLSATRAAADRAVRAWGGTTVRPGFVHGPGDRWFIPGLRNILGAAQAWVENGAAALSTISVDELGCLIADLALTHYPADRGALFHAAHPEPRSVRDIATGLAASDFAVPTISYGFSEALERAATVGLSARQIDLVGRDHTLDSNRLWRRTGRTPGIGPDMESSIGRWPDQ